MDWQPIDTAPFEQDLELAVIEGGETYSLVFPCRRNGDRWFNSLNGEAVLVRPTHWRYWRGISLAAGQ